MKTIKNYEKIKNLQETRKYGLDLLKIISMINIINLHINLFLPYSKIKIKSLKFKPIYRLEAFSYWPVNAFGLISGIVGYKKYKFLNMIYLWFIAVFYSLFFSIILYYKSKIKKADLILSFFPLGLKRNWYVNGYIFMYYFLPFVTNSISLINKRLYGKIVFHFFFIYSIYYTIIKYNIKKANFNSNFNFINEGYTSFWLLILYIVGGYIGKFYTYKNIKLNIIYLLIYLISSLITSEYLFYSVFLSLFQYYKSLANFKNVIKSFFPLGIVRHWYVNVYILMYLFLPFITTSISWWIFRKICYKSYFKFYV